MRWRCLEEACKWPEWSWYVFLVLAVAIACLLQPKPPKK